LLVADCQLLIEAIHSIKSAISIHQSAIPNVSVLIARVVGTVVATQKHRKFEGAKLLMVQPLNLDGSPRGTALLAVDGVGAGVHEKVLIVLEGRAAGEALGRKAAPVDAAVIGIIDQVDGDGSF
jgi:ethanolamine utilization protein EutN